MKLSYALDILVQGLTSGFFHFPQSQNSLEVPSRKVDRVYLSDLFSLFFLLVFACIPLPEPDLQLAREDVILENRKT